jgi:hypothetical protein
VWPAVVLYLAFVWLENVFSGSAVPRYLALSYTLIALYGMAFFGKETWLRRGEAFSVFFEMLVLMILYTVSSLWILAQPIVE